MSPGTGKPDPITEIHWSLEADGSRALHMATYADGAISFRLTESVQNPEPGHSTLTKEEALAFFFKPGDLLELLRVYSQRGKEL